MTDKYDSNGDVTDEYVAMLEQRLDKVWSIVHSVRENDKMSQAEWHELIDYIKVVVG